ncbi:hypothetical protein C8R42DRAFT_713341 [Lentinula raphanica]|nr:hypothetical protein C8R42DRAFT_713341 [Lentinula raphanica]
MNFNSRLGLFVLLASLSSAALGAVIDVKVKHSKETCMIGGCYTDPAAVGCANHFLGGPDCDAYYCRYPDYDTKLRVRRGPTYNEYVQDATGLGNHFWLREDSYKISRKHRSHPSCLSTGRGL